jgi:nucleoside-diphosphate-sugar epimerase
MELSGKQVLVTGADGTVGSAVVARLAREGAMVKAMTRKPEAAVRADLEDRAALGRVVAGCDLVIHCAAAVSQDPEMCRRVNVEGTRNLIAAMREAGCRSLVHISTVSVYDYSKGPRFDEDSELLGQPGEPYGYTKAEAERAIAAAVAERGLAATLLRLVMVLSTHPRSFWGPLALARARASSRPVFGLADAPHVHVDNVAEAVVLAARAPLAGRAYNVVDGHKPTAEYLEAVARAIGKPAPEIPAGTPRFFFSGERIRKELGYAPADRWQDYLAELSRLS